jgi:hypothetical protein
MPMVPDGLRDECFADANGSVNDHGFVRVEESEGGKIADGRGGNGRVVFEVEVFKRGWLFESCSPDAADNSGCVSSSDFVFAECLKKFEVSKITGFCCASRASMVSSIPDNLSVRSVSSSWCGRVMTMPPRPWLG